MSIISNIWSGMGSLLVRMPKAASQKEIRRFSKNQDLGSLRKDSQRIISDVNRILRKAARQ